MTTWSTDAVAEHFARSQQVLEAAGADRALVARVAEIAALITRTFRDGGKLLIAGNAPAPDTDRAGGHHARTDGIHFGE